MQPETRTHEYSRHMLSLLVVVVVLEAVAR
jgi:hypothetical protein